MRARASVVAAIVAVTGRAHAEPKPKPVDIKPFRDQLIVLQDAGGATIVVKPGDNAVVFFSSHGGPYYQQYVQGGMRDGDKWIITTRAPRAARPHLAHTGYRGDGTYQYWCTPDDDAIIGLTQVTADRAKQIIAKASFVTTGVFHIPRVIARDDTGVYYYVDELDKTYGGSGYRLFVGKKGAMKELALTDIATDANGDIYITKHGTLKIGRNPMASEDVHAWWIRGEKKEELTIVDQYFNTTLIYRELGIYGSTGTLCDDM